MKITIYDGRTNKEKKSLSRFKENVFSARFRQDGRMIVCGNEKGLVQTIDVKTKTCLRQLKGHVGPVHTTGYTLDNINVYSAGDDCSFRYWDVSTASPLVTIENAHKDYIRCSAIGPANSGMNGIIATGSYDHTVKLWDVRTLGLGASSLDDDLDYGMDGEGADGDDLDENESVDLEAEFDAMETGSDDDNDDENGDVDEEEEGEAGTDGHSNGTTAAASGTAFASSSGSKDGSLCTVDHGEPVTAVSFLPGGGTLVTAGGNTCKVWDIVGGGKLIQSFSSHQKLITSLQVDGSGSRLLTAGLDGLVKVHEIGTYKVTHTMHFPGQIFALGLPVDNSKVAVGSTDGTLRIHQRQVRLHESTLESRDADMFRSSSYRYFLRGRGSDAVSMDVTLPAKKRKKYSAFDTALKSFAHGKALDAALESNSPRTIVSVLEELISRSALLPAIRGRDAESLTPLVSFLNTYIAHPRYASICGDVTDALIDEYASLLGTSPELDALFERISRKIKQEVKLGKTMLQIQGSLDLLMAAASNGGSADSLSGPIVATF